MMQIYLEHTRHGKKIATDYKEAELDKKAGWREVTKDKYFNRDKVKAAKVGSRKSEEVSE